MKCRDLDRINFPRLRSVKPQKLDTRPVISIDTETVMGAAVMMSISSTDGERVVRIKSWTDARNEIIKLKGAVVTTWNLGYDERAILGLLPREDYLRLLDDGTHEELGLELIPDKCLTVIDGKTKIRLFDAAQFYDHGSLKSCAHLVGMAKGDEDVKNLDIDRYDNDPCYKSRIDEYAATDAKICRLLTERFLDACGIYRPRVLYSCASVSKAAYKIHRPEMTIRPPSPVMRAALQAYHGGRFEIVRRGHIENATTHDLVSAYPWAMMKTPHTASGVWYKSRTDDERALLRILRITATGDGRIGPLPYEDRHGGVFYPVGIVKGWYMSDDVDCAKAAGWRVKVHEAWLYVDPRPSYPWTYLKTFFDEKQRLEKSDPRRTTCKIILNSTYGCTIQLSPSGYRTVDTKEGAVDDAVVINGKLTGIERIYKAGVMFDAVTAAAVTAAVRKRLYLEALAAGSDLVAMATDSITTTGEGPVGGSCLGDWAVESPARSIIVMACGVQWDVAKPERPMKARGFGRRVSPLTIIEQRDKGCASVVTQRVVKARAGLAGWDVNTTDGRKKCYVNEFVMMDRELSPNADNRRAWVRDWKTVGEALDGEMRSDALRVNDR